jgi:hypothetical protein
MSDAMGPLTFGKKEEQIFLGREIAPAPGLQRRHGRSHRPGSEGASVTDNLTAVRRRLIHRAQA